MSSVGTLYSIAAGVELPEGSAGVADVVYEESENRYVRVGPGAMRILRAATQASSVATLIERSGRPAGDPQVLAAITRLESEGLLVRGAAPSVKRRGRFHARGPFLLQLDLVEPTRFIDAITRAIHAIGPRRVAVALMGILLAGLLAGLAQAGALVTLLHSQIGLGAGALALATAAATTWVHELAHGTALRLAGGVPRRVGIMLFYGVPGLYCDVSDAWRLRDPRARTAVCLAGIAAQLLGAAVCAIVAIVTSGEVHDGALYAMFLNAGIALFNLIPFIKLDGYLALVAMTGRSDLRRSALGQLKSLSAWLLVGAGKRPRVDGESVAFGAACAVTPALMVFGAASAYGNSLRGLGTAGAAIQLLLTLFLAVILTRLAGGFLATVRERGPSLTRASTAAVAVALVVITVGAIPTHPSRSVPFVAVGGRPMLVAESADALGEIAGRPVELERPALLPSAAFASGTVLPASAETRRRVPIDAGSPVRTTARLNHNARVIPTNVPGPVPREGIARVRTARISLARRAYDRVVRDPSAAIWSEVTE